jgi:hypothetical protein
VEPAGVVAAGSSRISRHIASMPKAQFSRPSVPISSRPRVFSGSARSAQPHTDDRMLKATICQNSRVPGCHRRLSFMDSRATDLPHAPGRQAA